MLSSYPKLRHVVSLLDSYLEQRHPQFFGEGATRPVSGLKRSKVIHDSLWGTNRFTWRELVLIDSPLLQRLRYIHQTGLAYHVYPCSRHSRFEHSLGVLTIASRIFDSLYDRRPGVMLTIANKISSGPEVHTMERLKQELRLAALLHDTGHSLFSHASEKVYSQLQIFRDATEELSDLVGKEKGAGEVISFCLAQTQGVAMLLDRAEKRLLDDEMDEEIRPINLQNVALLIVGSAVHPHLHFMGEIISSGLDADKLDYLLRDATGAGLPLRYDLERYLHTVELEKDYDVDPEGALEKLYRSTNAGVAARPAGGKIRFPHFDTYRLRLPKRATSTMEQIVICKIMLYSYIYHHQKVRASEGLLERLLTMLVGRWRSGGMSEDDIVIKFLDFDDRSIMDSDFLKSEHADVRDVSYRLANRVLPREVYRLSSAVSHAEGELLQEFFLNLKERTKRTKLVADLEKRIGDEMLKIDSALGKDGPDALWRTGAWVDAPKPPSVEEVELSGESYPVVTIENVFPVEEWTEAYQAHRYFVRIYSFSEHVDVVAKAARIALRSVIEIKTEDFFDSCRRHRN